MEQWHCFKCKEPMLESEVMAYYLEISSPIEGIKCPTCGTIYLLEKTVVEKVSQAEEIVENK